MRRLLKALAEPALSLPRTLKRAAALLADAAFCVLSAWLALCLRLGEFVAPDETLLVVALGSVVLALPVFVTSGFYRAIFRFSGFPAMVAVARASLVYGALFATAFSLVGVSGVPRTVGLIQPLLLLLFVGASRALIRIWLGGLYLSKLDAAVQPRSLIYGAGSAGRQLAAAMSDGRGMRLVGYLDDDERLHGQVLNGLPIFDPAQLAAVLAETHATDVLLALPSASRERRNAILGMLGLHKVAVRTLPALSDLVSGKVGLADVRELDLDDLLGRERVKPHGILLNRNTHNKTVLVTGAGGSIGSELCRQILATGPRRLLLLDMSEFSLYGIHQELLASMVESASGSDVKLAGPGAEIVPLLGSVCDEARMHEIMDTWRPNTVYHAAAYKHVPLVEHNPAEGLRNNVWGTKVCAEAAVRKGVQNFVLVSTDKAVRPTNIMGASKRLAEMVLQSLSGQNPAVTSEGGRTPSARTCFSMVRFGNVLGSSGSVVPLFRGQIKSGGPVTLTHPDITRYFMSIPEAAQLVIQAGAMGSGGDVFVLDMGQPVRIIDLARRMVELSGLSVREDAKPDGDIEIRVTGLRPGEKLYEELLIGDNPMPTQHPRIMRARDEFLAWPRLKEKLETLNMAVSVNDVPVIRGLLKELVQGYAPSGDVVDWVHLELEREARSKE